MRSGASIDSRPAAAGARTKKHSPVFLAVFTVFLIATLICAAGTVVGVLAARPSHHDTQWFWAAGHLLVHGANPYDREAIRQIELGLGLHLGSQVMMTLNPPYTLFLMAPVGLLSARWAVIAWSGFLAACLILSVRSIRPVKERAGEANYRLLAWCFAPALCCIEMGQTGLIVLLGLALFLRFQESRPVWAGAALSLCAVKPHLLLPFGLVLLAWVAVRRRWLILLGAACAVIAESLIAMRFDPSIWAHYHAMIRTEGFVGEFIPTLGVALRFVVDRTALWLEFVPAAVGSAWAVWFFWRNRDRWDWRTHGSVLTLVSLIVAPYAWFTDQVIGLPAILFALLAAGGLRRGSVTLLMAAMSAAALEMVFVNSLFFKPDMLWGVIWLVWYLYATSEEREPVPAVA